MTFGVTGSAHLLLAHRSRYAPRPAERSVFSSVNHGKREQPALRLPQQLGTPWVLPMVSAVGWATGRRRLAVAAALALPLEKGSEVLVKKWFPRPRPAESDEGARLHDDAPEEGSSYPSGHAAIAVCALGLIGPYLPVRAAAPLAMAAAVGAYARVRQGAHYPRDAVGGALLGLALSALLGFAVGRPAR